jgi:predicted DNA binding protein
LSQNTFLDRLEEFIRSKAEEATLEKYTFLKAIGKKLTDEEYEMYKAAYVQGMADGMAIDLDEIKERLN